MKLVSSRMPVSPNVVPANIVPAKIVSAKIVLPIVFLTVCAALLSCGGMSPSSIVPNPTPNIAGSWEFIAQSNNTGGMTAIDVALKEGSTLSNNLPVPNGQISADNLQIAFLSVKEVSTYFNATGFGGDCLPITQSNSLGPGSITALGSPITFSFTENGNVFNVTGSLSSDGTQVLNGTYTQQPGNTCADTGGTITGTKLSNLSGVFTGTMCALPGTSCSSQSDFTDTVTSATLSEGSGSSATLTLLLTGTDNTTFTMTGTVTGNAFSVTGTFQGQPVIFYGYYEQVVKGGNTVATLYLVNAVNPTTAIASLPSQ